MNYREVLDRRLVPRPTSGIDVVSKLQHFALINYALPKSRLERYIPADRFSIPEFMIGGEPLALMSAVPFVDADFHFAHVLPWLKFRFGQTNYRVYVVDKRTGEHAVWFFGTTLGSLVVYLPKFGWKIPWHHAHYTIDCRYNHAANAYQQFRYDVRSPWAAAQIELEDTGAPLTQCEGFESLDQMLLILTHPLAGYFYRSDNHIGTYAVWHEELRCTVGKPRNVYFSLYERMGLLSRAEMQQPHSIFICPETTFRVFLPPQRWADS